jgi:hypothetical protein
MHPQQNLLPATKWKTQSFEMPLSMLPTASIIAWPFDASAPQQSAGSHQRWRPEDEHV